MILDQNRLQPTLPMQQHYTARWLEFYEALLHEIFAMFRTARQLDAVKLVAVDLDDTLWRGVAAEGTLGAMEGWPMGFMETLIYLKKRGVLLAIVSKNDEQFIEKNFSRIVGGQIKLEDFAIRKINFQSKVQNLTEIIREVNLRPQNVVMVDDHPVERAAIRQQLPGVRLLGSQLYYLKRVLLWSSETQTPCSPPSRAGKQRWCRPNCNASRASDHVALGIFADTGSAVGISRIADSRAVNLNRALELFNKTNQFNTLGSALSARRFHERLAGRSPSSGCRS